MKNILSIAIVIGALCAASASFAKDGPSCYSKKASMCDDYPKATAAKPESKANLMKICRGDWLEDKACPKEQLAGTCENSVTTRRFYKDGDRHYTADTAKTYCVENMGGKFTPAP